MSNIEPAQLRLAANHLRMDAAQEVHRPTAMDLEVAAQFCEHVAQQIEGSNG